MSSLKLFSITMFNIFTPKAGHDTYATAPSVMEQPRSIMAVPQGPRIQKRSTGHKRCLFIGINYFGQPLELSGCVHDAYTLKSFLTYNYSLPIDADHVRIMTDEPCNEGTSLYPTRDNILASLKWLVDGAQPGDQLLLHYSGHGGLKRNLDGTETSGFDQTMYPVDFEDAGFIDDNEIHAAVVIPLAAGVQLTALLDCCHSGTLMDLPYCYANGVAISATKDLQASMGLCGSSLFTPFRSSVSHYAKETDAATVVCFSSCQDEQSSMDVCYPDAGCFGVMSRAWVNVLRMSPNATYAEIMASVEKELSRFGQTPCLSSNKPVDLKAIRFHL